MAQRETWTTRLGFILAAVGSAVGLGNIWGFPFQAGRNGGAAFLLVYLVVVLLVGLPAMLMEFVVGRRSKKNPVDAFRELGYGSWTFAGALTAFIAFWILSFYSVVGGWVIRYLVGSVTGAYFGGTEVGNYFLSIAMGPDAVAFHALFMLLSVGIVALGVSDGIERATKLMVPSVVVLLVGIAVWAATLTNAGAGYDFYLSPDLGEVQWGTVIPYAVGQAFFTLSLGMGAMITYASYLGEDDSLPADGGIIVVLNTLVGVLAGFVVFPVLFHYDPSIDLSGAGGSGTAFTTLSSAFAGLGGVGRVLASVFFFVLLIAALSSSISLLEVVTSYVLDNTDYERSSVSVGAGSAVFLFGLPAALGLNWLGLQNASGIDTLTWYNDIAYNLLLPLSVLAVAVFVGWVYGRDALDEIRRGSGTANWFDVTWLWFVRLVVPAGILFTLVLGVQTLLVNAQVLAGPVFEFG
ncbi:sodium-dependent transporter [halophilic archaeon]|nr:sodium-dependent transporter [halophilic archaeon]